MIQLTEEQQARLSKLRDRKQQAIAAAIDNYEFRPLPKWGDIDFLLSLLDSDSQAPKREGANVCDPALAANDIVLNSTDMDHMRMRIEAELRRWQIAYNNAATRMCDKCVISAWIRQWRWRWRWRLTGETLEMKQPLVWRDTLLKSLNP